MTARDVALRSLIACRRNGAWSDLELKQNIARERLDRRDAALATRLCCGVLQTRMLLDHWISLFLKGKPGDLQPVVLDILRLAVYQLHFLDRIPHSALVNEAVNQTKRLANHRAGGLVNGILRNMIRSPERMTLPEDLPTRYSHPAELVSLLRDRVGAEKLEALLTCHNSIPPLCLQINTVKSNLETVRTALTEDGLESEPHPWLPDCLILSGGSPEQTGAFREGLIYVQDPAAKLAVLAAAPREGMNILDCCAAPGGKSFAAAIAAKDRCAITSCDIHAHKIPLIANGAARLGLKSIRAVAQDASVTRPDWREAFDLVLADVPCSGLGVIRKKPDIRYKDLTRLAELPHLQRRILNTQAPYVKPGGLLLYSTCTILRRENEDVVSDFLQSHPDFHPEPFSLPGGLEAPDGWLTLLPCDHGTDGFFIARLRKTAE